MVATERIRRADTEEELKEAQSEKEALRSALKLLETENSQLKRSDTSVVIPLTPSIEEPTTTTAMASPSPETAIHHRRTSSQLVLKSAPGSPTFSASTEPEPPFPSSPVGSSISEGGESRKPLLSLPLTPTTLTEDVIHEIDGAEAGEEEEPSAVEDDDDDSPQVVTSQSSGVLAPSSRPASLHLGLGGAGGVEVSPWADVPSLSGVGAGFRREEEVGEAEEGKGRKELN